MALIDNDNTNQSTQQAAPQQAAQSSQGNQEPRKAAGFWSFHQQNVVNNPVAAGVGGEYFTKMRTQLAEIYKDIAGGVDVRIISLNRQNMPALRFSALVVACRMPEINKQAVAFHTLILEATGEKLQPAVRQIDNQQVRVNRVTSDAYDEVLYKTAFDAVTAEFANSFIYSADAMVVPANVNVEKKEVVENLARNAAMACVSVINAVTSNFGELNLAYMDRDCRFVIDVTFGNHQVYDVVGNPQRSSVLIGYSSQKKNANSLGGGAETVNIQDSVVRICELSGFLNAIWAPTEQQGGLGFHGYMNPNIPVPTQKFAAEFVITSVRTDYATSPAAVLLAMSSFLALVDNDTWIQALLPKPNAHHAAGGNKIDITDIGALNITANIANQTDKGGFGTEMGVSDMKGDIGLINKYLVSIFRPGVVISMDCPEAGPASWYMSVFAAAASGDQEAYNQIYQAAQELTNNQFERFFKQGDQMFTNIVRVPLGHYKLNDTLQDIRNIDYTAIANLYKSNPSMIHDYSNTFVERPGVSAARNLAIREGIIMHALNEQAEITGYAARVSVSDGFVRALSSAIAECNLPVTVNTPLNSDQLRTGTAAPSFIQSSLSHNTRTFQTGYSQARPQQQYRFGAHGGYQR